MRKILNSWLFIAVLLSALFSYAAVADTLTRPYGSSDYAGGARAVGSKINTEFDTVVNWLNGGNISSQNIAALGVSTSNIDDEAVTPIKMAERSVGRGAITVTSVSTTIATTISDNATLTGTLGRPVMVGVNATSVGGFFKIYSDSLTEATATIEIWRDGTMVSSQTFGVYRSDGSGKTFSITIPASSFTRVDSAVATGTRNYFLKAKVNDANATLTIDSGVEIYAYEL